MVMESPYYAVTDDERGFAIPDAELLSRLGLDFEGDIPAGTYLINAWHEKLKTAEQESRGPRRGTGRGAAGRDYGGT